MARTACVNVYRYLLQIVLLREQRWHRVPCVVISEDRPGGTVLDVNSCASHLGVRPGMRFSAALSLAPDLRAGVVSPAERDRVDREIIRTLYRFSPEIESFSDYPGVFRTGVGGLERIAPSPRAWASSCRGVLAEIGFRCHVAVGPTRAGTYVAAMYGGYGAGRKSREDARPDPDPSRRGDLRGHEAGITVCSTAEEEIHIFSATPLEALTIARRDRGLLTELGIETVAAFRAMPTEGVRTRFGRETVDLHAFLRGEGRELPVASADIETEHRYSRECPYPIRELDRLFRLLDPLLRQVEADHRRSGEQVAQLALELRMDDAGTHRQTVSPAQPTRNAEFLSRLMRLRLEQASLSELSLSAGVTRCSLRTDSVPVVTEQGMLFHHGPELDGVRVTEAISRIRARFGCESVGRFVPRDGYLPEDALAWEAVDRPLVDGPDPTDDRNSTDDRDPTEDAHRFPWRWPPESGPPTLVRRVLSHPVPLQTTTASCCAEPYCLSGGWWKVEYRRVYRYLETTDGRILWICRDGRYDPWMIQGFVE